jgi:hypothetical protein
MLAAGCFGSSSSSQPAVAKSANTSSTLNSTGTLANPSSSDPSSSVAAGTPSIAVAVGRASRVLKPPEILNPRFQPNDSLDVVPETGGATVSSSVSAAGYVHAAKHAVGPWTVYWPTGTTSAAISSSPFPGPNESVPSPHALIPSSASWDNGGAWVNSVFRLGDGNLVAFFHAEHHYGCNSSVSPPELCPRATFRGKGRFWASAGVAYSTDSGKEWSAPAQFLTSPTAQPATPSLGGDNFYRVVWDMNKHRWMAFFGCKGGMSCAAISNDTQGRPGTWFNYDDGQFDEPGLGGTSTPLPGLEGVHGVIYSVQYDAKQGIWLAWGREFKSNGVFVTASYNLIYWNAPKLVVGGVQALYPVVVGTHGTDVVGATGVLYYVTGIDVKEPVLWMRSVQITAGV